MAVHHITEEMVADKPVFVGSPAHKLLVKQADNVIFVAHNAAFDMKMLEREGIVFPNYICTLKVIRHMDEKGLLESYQLQYLRYYFKMKVEAVAHDAWGDILVLELLLSNLIAKYRKKNNVSWEQAVTDMMKISSVPSTVRTFQFGKHKGKLVTDVFQEDRGYLEWLYGQKKAEPEGEEDWLHTLSNLLG